MFVILFAIIIVFWILCGLKKVYPGVDRPKKFNIFWTVISFIDFYGCILFVYGMSDKDHGSFVKILLMVGVIILICQWLMSIILLGFNIRRFKALRRATYLKEWLNKCDKILWTITILSSCHQTAIELCDSHILPKKIFNMRLPKKDMYKIR